MADVRLRRISKRYGQGAPVIHDLNLAVRDQEFLVLVGPSGCGKSTALRMVAGLERPTTGDILVDGQRINDVPPERRDMAMVFQGYALFPHMSVYENLAFSLKVRHLSRAEIARRVSHAAALLGITGELQRRPTALSGGQQQRVALGRAIVREPRVFLMDEPLSNLDAQLRVQMRAEIARLHQQVRVTTIYVTHDQTEAMTMGDRVAVMKDGRLQQVDTPLALYDRPANLFVAGFIGSPAMNLFDATLRTGPTGPQLVISSEMDARTLALPDSARWLSAHATTDGRAVVAGIRPEDLRLAAESEPNTLLAEVDVVEHLGNEQIVYLRLPGALLTEQAESRGATARVAASLALRPGERIALAVDVTRLHLFDPATTLRLEPVTAPVA
jgi:multiple sugar transport system ATP-binding protein